MGYRTREQRVAWRRSNPDKVAVYVQRYREKHPNSPAFWAAHVRFRAYAVLGGRCALCNTDDPTVLQFNHINGGGAEHRRKLSGSINAWVLNNQQEAKKSIELLCANCHARLHSGFTSIEGYMDIL